PPSICSLGGRVSFPPGVSRLAHPRLHSNGRRPPGSRPSHPDLFVLDAEHARARRRSPTSAGECGVSVSPQLLAILVCPKCRGELEYREAESSLICKN